MQTRKERFIKVSEYLIRYLKIRSENNFVTLK